MSEIAKSIELVIRDKGPSVLLIDGKEFPWTITSDDLELTSEVDGVPVARVAILAKHISTRFESAPSDPVPEGDEWTVGWRFNISAVGPPPATVLALRQVDNQDDLPYLVPVEQRGGYWNVWSWASSPFSDPNPDYTYPWHHLAAVYYDSMFEVVHTRGDDSDDVRPVH
jgi:hypothetical protein